MNNEAEKPMKTPTPHHPIRFESKFQSLIWKRIIICLNPPYLASVYKYFVSKVKTIDQQSKLSFIEKIPLR